MTAAGSRGPAALRTGCVIVPRGGRGRTVRVVADVDERSGLVWVKSPANGDLYWMEAADVERHWRRDRALEGKLARGEMELPPHRNLPPRPPRPHMARRGGPPM
mgnify:CR=1 FL=1